MVTESEVQYGSWEVRMVFDGPRINRSALLPCLQTIRVSDRVSGTVIGRTRHVTTPVCGCIDWLTGPKIRIAGLTFANSKWVKQFT